ERPLHLAAGSYPLVHLGAQVAFHQRRRLGPGEVVQPRHAQRADLEHVAEPARGDQPDPRPLQFQNGVRRHRRPVQPVGDRRAVRNASVAAASTCRPAITTPYWPRAASTLTNSLRTSRSTAAGSRSSGSPHPPAPATSCRNTSPRMIIMLSFEPSASPFT